ncbi:MAG: HD domain-containing protein [Alphaproteobacteria bacterium]|nr:HD domain-containing protein [Alphaproteobacteria bacterium]
MNVVPKKTSVKAKSAYDLVAEGVPFAPQAKFRSLAEATMDDWVTVIARNQHKKNHVLRLCLEHLEMLKEPAHGFPVDRFVHSLQTATRAWRDGYEKDDEMIVAALLHDIGDFFSPHNHGEFVAAIIKAYVRPEVYWTVKHHEMFIGYHLFHFLGLDRNACDVLRGHKFAKTCQHFCDAWDQASFDPDYDTMPLEAFMPALERVFAKPKRMVFDRIHED